MPLISTPQGATVRLAGDLASALDPVVFARKVGIEPDPWQAQMLRSHGDRILCCSRQSGKSTVSAIAAMHEAVYNPGSLTLLLAPVGRQSQELLGKVRDVYGEMEEDLEAETENRVTLQLENSSRIVVIPDKEGNVRGFSGVNLVVIDEAAWVRDSTYQAVRPMLAVSQGRLLLLSTPNGKRGFFHYEWTEGGSDWHRSMVTAEQCPRISPTWLADERQKIPAAIFAQEYQCSFNEAEDAVFSHDDIRAALTPTLAPLFAQEAA